MTTTDTRAALEDAIRYAAGDFIREGDERAIDRAITAHVEAEVARRLAAAPDVEAAIGDLSTEFCISSYALDPLLAAIAADKARAVEAARPTPDEARRLVEALRLAAAEVAATGCMHASGPDEDSVRAEIVAEAALLRALGVEA